MKVHEVKHEGAIQKTTDAPAEVIKVERKSFGTLVEEICRSPKCRYPLLAIRILIYVMTSVDAQGRMYISARQLSKLLDVNYDTTTKCLKFLREIEVMRFDL